MVDYLLTLIAPMHTNPLSLFLKYSQTNSFSQALWHFKKYCVLRASLSLFRLNSSDVQCAIISDYNNHTFEF